MAFRVRTSRTTLYYCFAVYLLMATTNALPYDSWTQQSSLLPRKTSQNAIGVDTSNHTIWLLGADRDDSPKQLVSFNYLDNTFTDHGAKFLPEPVYGFSQNYAQIGSILYVTEPFGADAYIHTFNMYTMIFASRDITAPLKFLGDDGGAQVCLVGIRDEYLATIDGNGVVQILNINTNIWLDDIPSLQIPRFYVSCTYLNDKMFIIGGSDAEYYQVSSIEYLQVSITSMMNIASMTWKYTANEFPETIAATRCFNVNDDVLVIGGGITRSPYMANTVYVIDSITTSVSFGGYLAFETMHTSGIFVDNIAYIFGGSNSGTMQFWQVSAPISTSSAPTTSTTTTTTSTDYPTDVQTTNSVFLRTETSYLSPTFTTALHTTNPNAVSTVLTASSISTTAAQTSSASSSATTGVMSIYSSDSSSETADGTIYLILFIFTLSLCIMLIVGGAIVFWFKSQKKKEGESDHDNVGPGNIVVELSEMENANMDQQQRESIESMYGDVYNMEGVIVEQTTTTTTATSDIHDA